MEKKITAEILFELNNIFQQKGWKLEEENKVGVFNRFIDCLSRLSHEQQLLILELTTRFIRVGFQDYFKHCEILFQKLEKNPDIDLDNLKKIYVVPLIEPKDVGSSKSSTVMCYLFKSSTFFRYSPKFHAKEIVYLENLEIDPSVNDEKSLILVIDDFIGTGKTAKSAIDYIIDIKKIDTSKIIVLAIAAMNVGVNLLSSIGIHVITSISINKGITDYLLYSEQEREKKLELMSEIESTFAVHPNECWGYDRSEALIEMTRTPNNTFPFFWKTKKNRPAPFPRYPR